MIEREKFIDLVCEGMAESGCGLDCNLPSKQYCDRCVKTADYLLRFLASELNLPPCKIGDKIYVIPSSSHWRINNMYESMKPLNRIYEQTVDEIHIYRSGYSVSSCEGVQHQPSVLFGETWFLTREEAEKALKGREEK